MTIPTIQSKIENILTLMGFENIPTMDASLHTWIDSLEVVELVIEVEKTFEIGILNEEIETLKTINDLVQLVNKRVNE